MARKPSVILASVDTLVSLARDGEDQRYWYNHGEALVDAIADATGHHPWDVAVVMAATSPQTSVRHNIALTLRSLALLSPRSYPFAMRETDPSHAPLDSLPMLGSNATAIRKYTDALAEGWDWDRAVSHALGPKTGPFARALSGDGDALVLDTWMFRAAIRGHKTRGERWRWAPTDPDTTSRMAGWVRPRPSTGTSPNRDAMVARIQAAADRLGWTVRETQAAIWAGTLRAYGRRTGIDLLDTARRAGLPLE